MVMIFDLLLYQKQYKKMSWPQFPPSISHHIKQVKKASNNHDGSKRLYVIRPPRRLLSSLPFDERKFGVACYRTIYDITQTTQHTANHLSTLLQSRCS
jgi:hypothetical protein